MNNKHRVLIAIIAVVIVVGAAVAYAMINASNTAAPATNSNSSSSPSSSSSNSTNQTVASVITYDGSTFNLSVSTVAAGSRVEIKNASTSPLDFDSDPHPTHTDEPELNQGAVDPGQSKTFTITKKGTWGFHNHEDPTQHGNITVN